MGAFVSPSAAGRVLRDNSAVAHSRLRGTQLVRTARVSPRRVSWSMQARVQVERDLTVEINGAQIAYDYLAGQKPTVFFLPGFYNARYRDSKVNAMEINCRRKGQGFLAPDYYGTGRSEGDFKDGTVSRWVEDSVALLDEVLGQNAKVVLVGAGVGGWIMLHLALQRPRNVIGLVGITADPDFTDDLLAPNMTPEQVAELNENGVTMMTWGIRTYPISKKLIEDGATMGLLKGEAGGLDIRCPVRLFHGLKDEEIPPEQAMTLLRRLRTNNVNVTFFKNGDHVLESEDNFATAWDAVCELSDQYFEYDLTSPGSG